MTHLVRRLQFLLVMSVRPSTWLHFGVASVTWDPMIGPIMGTFIPTGSLSDVFVTLAPHTYVGDCPRKQLPFGHH